MKSDQKERVEELQRMVAKTVALNPAGRNLLLIGGFRFRFLDQSVRASDDIDYHWSGDLAEKQKELLALFERKLLPEVRRRLGYECSASLLAELGDDPPAVRSVGLAFWKNDDSFSRIEIPVEITRIVCADPVAIRTADGSIYPTVSDADMVESKVIALFNRTYLRHRDMVDIFLFGKRLLPDSSRRLAAKCKTLGVSESAIRERMNDFRNHKDVHARTVQEVVDTQLDAAPAAQIRDAGGGRVVMDEVLRVLDSLFPTGGSHESH